MGEKRSKKDKTRKSSSGEKSKRELIDTRRDKRFVRRDEKGRFDKVSDVGRATSKDSKRSKVGVRTTSSGPRAKK